jgi:hypothetical protein
MGSTVLSCRASPREKPSTEKLNRAQQQQGTGLIQISQQGGGDEQPGRTADFKRAAPIEVWAAEREQAADRNGGEAVTDSAGDGRPDGSQPQRSPAGDEQHERQKP